MKLTLGVKLSSVFSILIGVSSISLIVYSYFGSKDILMKESMARFNSISTNLAFSSEYGVLTKNAQALDKIVRGVMQEKDVNLVKITDKSGAILSQMGKVKQPAYETSNPVKTKKVSSGGGDADLLFGSMSLGEEPPAAASGESAEAASSAQMEEIGRVQVEFDLAPIQEKMKGMRNRAVLLVIIFIIVGILITNFAVRVMFSPLIRAVNALAEIATGGGNLTKKLEVKSEDEVGELGGNFNKFIDTLAGIIRSVRSTSNQVATSSKRLTTVSQEMAKNVQETSAQANIVSAAADQVSKNIQTVATGTEEMSTSIKEIAKNVSEAAKVATAAVKVADATNVRVSKLGESSAEIGNIIKVISSIAEQTNLLALNATIEAARAGEAGKGFAVVANEVKELAKETAKSTEDIRRKIEIIQADTKGAVDAIQQISAIINQINDFQNTIASSVDEQTRTTNEISYNIIEAAKGSSEIAQNVTQVAQAIQNTSIGASDTQKAATELSQMASELQKVVGQFKSE